VKPADISEIKRGNIPKTNLISRYFRNKRREYFKDKINTLAINSKIKNIRDLYREIN
jgi:hypothetical protein